MTYSIQKRNLPINVGVHFDKNGGDSVSYEYAKYKLGEKYGSFPTATKDDNFFEGWYKESSATNKVLSSDEVDFRQETLFAGYTPLKEMTFNADGGTFTGGSDVVTKKFAPNHPFNLYGLPQNPTKTDLNFCGWYTGLSATGTKITGNSIVPSVPTTYYADWKYQKLYRYIKFKISAIKSGSYLQVSKLELIDSNSNYYNYPSGTSVTANSSSFIGGESPSNLIDHSVYTKMCGWPSLPLEVIIDLKSSVLDLMAYTRWQWYTANDTASYSGRNPISFSILFSNDKVRWDQADIQTNYNSPAKNYALAYTGNLTI